MGVDVVCVEYKKGLLNLPQLMDKLGSMGISSVMVEGGSEISGNIIKEKLIDKVVYFFAPKIIGGRDAPGAVGGLGVSQLKDAIPIKDVTVEKLGDDLMIKGSVY